jgi:hypothetical protein
MTILQIKSSDEKVCPSPDGNGISRFRKTRLFAVVFVNREYSGQQDQAPY